MAKDLKINEKEIFSAISKEYYITLDSHPVCAPFNNEPGVFDNVVMKLYNVYVECFGVQRVKLVCLSTFNPNGALDNYAKDVK